MRKKQIYKISACGNYYTLTITSKGKKHSCLFDVADKALVEKFCWCVIKGYAQAYVPKALKYLFENEKVLMHVLILQPRAPLITNHRNNKKLDNRRFNLEENTHSQNSRSVLKRANTFSKYKGVSDSKRKKNPFAAHIGFNKKLYFLGNYPNQELAALAYNREALANNFVLKFPNAELEANRALYEITP